jgi:hypothetical protein
MKERKFEDYGLTSETWLKMKDYQRDEIRKNLKEKNYLITAYLEGDMYCSFGDPNRMVGSRRYYAVVSLEEIPDYIKRLNQPFWNHESYTKDKKLTKKEIENIPFDEKKWGIYSDIRIEPLSEDLENSYLESVENGFFETLRNIHDEKSMTNKGDKQ